MNQGQKIKKSQVTETKEDIQELAGVVFPTMQLDGHANVSAAGANIEVDDGHLSDATSAKNSAFTVAEAATQTEKNKKKLLVDSINKGADAVMLSYPNNPDKWSELGFPLTKETVGSVGVCDQVVGLSMGQGNFHGTCDIVLKPCAGAEEFTFRVTKDDPTVEAGYIDIKNPLLSKTLDTTVQILPDYLNKPLFFKVTGHNTHGPGPESDPFGGTPIY